MHLEASDPSFIDALITPNAGRNDRLDRIDRLIDWPKVAAILDDVHTALEGRPAYRPITMVKIIVLQQWHDASDAGMEEALQDRLSFRRFTELTLMDAVPDHSTISRFRKKITERGLVRMLFVEVNGSWRRRACWGRAGEEDAAIGGDFADPAVAERSHRRFPGARNCRSRRCGGYAKVSYKGRGCREAAGEGTGDAPPDDDGADDDNDDGAAPRNRHSGVGRNPEGAGAAPASPDPADVPLDRFFIRF